MFRILVHEETCVISDKIVGDFEVAPLRLDAGLPSDAIDNEPCAQMLVPLLCQCFKREAPKEVVDVGVFQVPRPPLFLLLRMGCHRPGHRWLGLALALLVFRRAERTRLKDTGSPHHVAS